MAENKQDNHQELKVLIRKLEENPLFYLFISSRELFHSNFWSWLFRKNKKETIKLFINNFDDSIIDNYVAKREHNQTKKGDKKIKSKVDLLFSVRDTIPPAGRRKKTKIIDHPKIVIENKVKDFPTIDQLTNIKKSFNDVKLNYVLTTLFWKDDFEIGEWDKITYKEIGERIDADKFETYPFEKGLIERYKDLCLTLHSITMQLDFNSQNYDFYSEFDMDLCNILDSVKLWEGYQKLRASLLRNWYIKHFANEMAQFKIETNHGINHQKATINFEYHLNCDYSIGIQLEGNEFRKFVAGANSITFAENLLKENLFFDSQMKPIKNTKFRKYGENFRFKYESITKHHTYSYGELCEKINSVFRTEIDPNLENIINQIPKK